MAHLSHLLWLRPTVLLPETGDWGILGRKLPAVLKQNKQAVNLIPEYYLIFLFPDISDIPESIKGLKALQVADFSSNPIPQLPAGFVQLKHLTTLGLNDMSLTQLPPDFGALVSLTSLELRENLLKSLPESLANLTRLERLDLGDNEIEELVRIVWFLSE